MNLILPCLLAFGIAIAIDYVYASWLVAINDKRTLAACVYSFLCPLLGSLSLLVFLDHWVTLFPASLGHAAGTWLALTCDRRVREYEQRMEEYDRHFRSLSPGIHEDLPGYEPGEEGGL
jgi:hypothetical protein